MLLKRQSDRSASAPTSGCARPDLATVGRRLVSVGWLVFLSVLPGSLSAQDERDGSAPKPVSAAEAESKSASETAPLQGLPAEYEYLKGPDGKLVPVRRDATMKNFLKFLEQDQHPTEIVPVPAVARLELTGHADDEWAQLKARVVIHNPQSKGYSPLALGLHEAVLRDWKQEGPGDMYPRRDRSQGQVWWIQGQGDHVLTLEFSAPIKKQAPNRRLQLTLPESTVSLLELTCRFHDIKLTKEIEGTSVQIAAEPGAGAD
ncbi:MAG: hypothetical protein U0872_12040 [Planctomycetaceae bacterium]